MFRVQPIVLQSSPVAGRRSAPAVQPKRMSSRSKQASRLPVSAPAPVLAALSPSAASTLSPARNPKRCPNIPYNDLLATHDAVSFLVNAPTLPPALALQPPQIRPPSRARTLSSIPQLREAISDIDSRVAALLDERARLEFSLEQAVRLQAPIQRLPNELLSSIFSIGVADDEEPLAPWTIMLVCRQWVSVARDTPTLWSRIVVSPQHSLTHARLCLARSKTVPVDISIAFDPRSESPGASSSSVEIVARALDLFVPQMWRWRSFHLAVPGPAQAHDALARCASPAPLLNSLKIRIFSSFQDEDVRLALPPALLASSAPRLRECTLHSLAFDWTAHTASLAGLRVLDIGGYWSGVPPTVQKILDVLRQCPGIEEFALRHMPDIDQKSSDPFAYEPLCGARIPVQTIALPRLRKATFDYAGVQRTRAVLSQLTFPALEEIDFCYVENLSLVMPHLNRQALTSLPLRRLRIEQGSCAEKDLLRFLAWAPGLTTLELIDVEGISSSLLHIMAQPAQHTWICPSLETLLLDGCTTLTFEVLRSFVESRLSPHARAYPHTATPSWTVKPQTSRHDIYLSHDDGPARTPRSSRSAPALCRSQSTPPQDAIDVSGWPRRLRRLGLARCHQFSREMLQRLRMYVPDVKLGAAYDPTSS